MKPASKQQKAWWRNRESRRAKWMADLNKTHPDWASYRIVEDHRLIGHDAGWTAGIAWARRNGKPSRNAK